MSIDASGNMWLGADGSVSNIHVVGVAAPVRTPTAVAVTPAAATVTAWSVGADGATATFTVSNSYAVGTKVLLSGFATGTFLNGQNVAVTSSTSTSFVATVTGGTANGGATENGAASTSRLGTRP
jgi:hypothetical protein